MSPERLQKLLAQAGVCSRRGAEALIRQQRVLLNGSPACLGDQADPLCDEIRVDGRPLPPPQQRLALLLHKPRGVHSTCSDPQGRRTVLDLLPPHLAHGTGLHPVGRLDADSRGALLLSNDGALTLALTHPRYDHPKRYRVWVSGAPTDAVLQRWSDGVPLDGQPSRPVTLKRLKQEPERCLLELTLQEGRNRQIRRTADLLGHPVQDLLRLAIGPVVLHEPRAGQWRWPRPVDEGALQRFITATRR